MAGQQNQIDSSSESSELVHMGLIVAETHKTQEQLSDKHWIKRALNGSAADWPRLERDCNGFEGLGNRNVPISIPRAHQGGWD